MRRPVWVEQSEWWEAGLMRTGKGQSRSCEALWASTRALLSHPEAVCLSTL